MNSIKCARCGMVNWSSEVECRKCGSLLTVQEKLARNAEVKTPESKALFSGVIKFLTLTLVLAAVGLVLSMLNVINGDAAIMVAVTFMLVGVAFAFLTQLCLIVRIFQQSVGWGIGTLFIPLVGLIAVAVFWEKTRRSFLGHMICLGIMFARYFIMPASFRAESVSRY